MALILWWRRSFWVKKAHRLAAASDIALPGVIEGRIVVLLRRESLATAALVLPGWLIGTTVASMSGTALIAWYPWMVTALPACVIVIGFVTTLWPRWTGGGGRRLAHLHRVNPRDVFTAPEWALLLLGLAAGAGAGSWGLGRVHAGFAWWLVWWAAVVAAARIWWWTAQSALDRPSAAADVLELGWDDVMRFRRLRALGAGTAWGVPVLIVCLDSLVAFDQAHGHSLSLLPIVGWAAALVVMTQIFQQGHNQWRRIWLSPSDRAPHP